MLAPRQNAALRRSAEDFNMYPAIAICCPRANAAGQRSAEDFNTAANERLLDRAEMQRVKDPLRISTKVARGRR